MDLSIGQAGNSYAATRDWTAEGIGNYSCPKGGSATTSPASRQPK